MRSLLDLRTSFAWLSAVGFLLAATQATAFPGILNDWQARYGAVSPSGDNAVCQLCHENANGGSSWNAYGWDVLQARADLTCDLDMSGGVSNAEAFFCIESENSDLDSGAHSNLTEIGVGTQPGWTVGASNTIFTRVQMIHNQLPPANVGPVDPDGTEPLPPVLPPPPGDSGEIPADQIRGNNILVKPGQSIQAALDIAEEGNRIYVLPGVYRELSDATNGLRITKNGIKLVGDTKGGGRVILENAGNQRNGIVIVPPMVEDCMSCHTTMGPPFTLLPGVEPGLPDPEPLLYDIEIRGITIQGFSNNGLFTERVDGFKFVDVESIDNPNYGIFPTLSKNGLITRSKAIGSDLDSGIWVETSENVVVSHNLVEGNVNGFEVSNSDDIVLTHNMARNNTVGMAILLLPDIFDDRPGAKRITIERNKILNNNKENTARAGSILAAVPKGTGILHLGVDDSLIARNLIADNEFSGIAIVDYCLVVEFTDFPCEGPNMDPSVTPEFILDQAATNNRVERNSLRRNGLVDDPGNPFAFAAADISYISGTQNSGNCHTGNVFTKLFSLIYALQPCP